MQLDYYNPDNLVSWYVSSIITNSVVIVPSIAPQSAHCIRAPLHEFGPLLSMFNTCVISYFPYSDSASGQVHTFGTSS